VAAGSVITDNVPPDALAIARGRQTNKPGWAKARRAMLKEAAHGAKKSRSKRRATRKKARPRAKSRRR
jgi:hypothetical protein